MRWEYDPDADALYIRVVDGVPVARTQQVDPRTLVDPDRAGRVAGIEVLHPGYPGTP